MKLAALCLIVVGLATGAAVSCSVNHRSGDFACTTKANCAAGRDCIDGFCALPQLDDAGVADTLPGPGIDSASCPSECTSCNVAEHSCKIDCDANPAACGQRVTCPFGWACDVNCSTPNSCRGLDCAGSTSCTVTCSGPQSCRNIACSTSGTCGITCSGPDSCNGVNCGTGTCNVNCSGLGSCPAVDCGLGTCTIGCTNDSSCANVTCGLGACNVGCAGNDSCDQVDCGLSCACEVDCRPTTCANDAICKAGCSGDFGGCTSEGQGCNQCL